MYFPSSLGEIEKDNEQSHSEQELGSDQMSCKASLLGLPGALPKSFTCSLPKEQALNEVIQFWDAHIKIPPKAIIDRVLQGLHAPHPGKGVDLDAPIEINIARGASANELQLLVQVRKVPGAQYHGTLNYQLVANRTFTFKEGKLTVKEIRTDVDTPGCGRKLYCNCLSIYRTIHVQEIHLDATDAGKYAWSRYGFIPTSQEEWGNITGAIKERGAGLFREQLRQEMMTALSEQKQAVQGALEAALLPIFATVGSLQSAMSALGQPPEDEDPLSSAFHEKLRKVANDKVLEPILENIAEERSSDFEAVQELLMEPGQLDALLSQAVRGPELNALRAEILGPKQVIAGAPQPGTLILACAGDQQGVTPEIAQQVEAILNDPHPRAMRRLAMLSGEGQPQGTLVRSLLSHGSMPVWAGQLDLTSPEDVKYLEAYIGYSA